MTLLTKTFALASFTSALAFMALPSLAADYDFPHIETSGASEIVIDADMAVVNIEVVVEAPTSKAAKDASDKAISQFLSRLKQVGVDKHDIQSANLSFDLNLETINRVGSRLAVSREIQYPIDLSPIN